MKVDRLRTDSRSIGNRFNRFAGHQEVEGRRGTGRRNALYSAMFKPATKTLVEPCGFVTGKCHTALSGGRAHLAAAVAMVVVFTLLAACTARGDACYIQCRRRSVTHGNADCVSR